MAGGSAVFLDVLPSMAKFGTNLTRSASVQAAKAGQAVGRTFSGAMNAGAAQGGSGAQAAVAQLEAASKKATRVVEAEKARIYQARQGEVAAAKQVAAAESTLAAQRAKHGAESAQALKAEASLATARGRVQIAAVRTTAVEDQLRAAMTERRTITQQLAAAQNTTTTSTNRMSRGLAAAAAAGEPLAAGMGRAAGGIRRVAAGALATVKPLASMAAGFGAIIGIGKVITLGNEYTKTMNELQAVTASTDAQMVKTSATARLLGSDLSLPATSGADAAAIMVELAKGGLTLQGSMDAAKGTIQLAAAAQIDGARAAEVQANALNQFGLAAKDAGMVADVLANTANAAAGGVTDIATSLKYVGPVARSLGIDINDTAASIGLLANQGLKGDTAGTALRGMLASLARPSKQAQKGVDALGLSVFDSQGKFVGMRAVIESLSEAQKTMTQEQFAVNSVLAFGREPLAAITALASEGTKGFDGMSKAVGRQGGAAAVAQSQMKGLGGAMDKLESQLEDVALGIYQTVTPALTAAVNGIAGGLDGAGSKVQKFLDIAGAVGRVAFTGKGAGAPAMQGIDPAVVKGIQVARTIIVGAFQDIARFVTSSLIPSLRNIAIAVAPTVAIFGGVFLAALRAAAYVLANVVGPALVAVTGFLRDNQWAVVLLAGVLSTLVGAYLTMRVVPGVIGAVTTATMIAKRAQEGFALASYGSAAAMQAQGRAGKVGVATFVLWKAVVTTAKAVGFAFTAATKGMAAAQIAFNIAANANPLGLLVLGVVAVVAAIAGLVAGVIWAYKNLGWFKTAVDAVWLGIKVGAKAVGDAAVWLWQKAFVPAWQGIAAAAQWAWSNVIKPTFDGIVGAGKAVGAAFVWLWQSVIQPTFAWIGGAARAVGGAFTWLWQSVISPVFVWIGNAARGLWDGFLFPIFDLLSTMIRVTVGAAFVWLRDSVIVPVVSGIVAQFVWWRDLAVSVFTAVVTTVRNTVGAVFVWLRDTIIRPVFTFIATTIAWWWTTTVANFTAVVNFVRGVLGAVFTWLRDSVIRPVFSFIAGVFVTWWSGVRATFSAVVSFLRSTLGPVFTWLRDSVIRPVFDGIKGTISNTWRNGIKPIFDAVKNFAMKTIPDAFTKMKEGVKSAWDAVKTTAKAPIKFVVNTVINDALIGNFNKVATAFGTKKMSTISLPKGFAGGGVIPGYQSAKRDDVMTPMRKGEGVLVPEVVRALSPAFVHGLNALGNRGGTSAVRNAVGYAKGGVVGAVTSGWDWAKGAAGKAWDWTKNAAETAANVVTDPMGTLGKLVKSVIGKIPGAGSMVDMAGGMGRKVLDSAVAVLKRIGEGDSGAGTGKNGDLPRSALMKVSGFAPGSGVGAMGGYLRIAAARAWQMMQKASGGALGLTEGYRDLANQNKRWAMYRAGGNLAALPGTSVHGLGNAADIGAGQAWARANGARYGWVNTGLGFSQREPWHFEYKGKARTAGGSGMALGGIVDRPSLYDDGGELQVGTHLYAKNTREPEYALPEGRLVEIVEKASRNSSDGGTTNITATVGGTGNHHEDLRDIRRAATNRRRGGRGRNSR